MELDRIALRRACEQRYEAGRRRLARLRVLFAVTCVTALALVQAWFGLLRPAVAVSCALVLAVLVYIATVRGLEAWRGTRIGAAAGLLPLVSALGAESLGMVCTPAGCSSLCIPACVISGCVAALWIARKARASSVRSETWATAGIAATAVGSLGCACVGYTGAVVLALVIAGALGASAALTGRASAAR